MDLFPTIQTDFIEESPAELDEEKEDDDLDRGDDDGMTYAPQPKSPKPKLEQSEIFVDKPVIKPIKEDKPVKKKRVITEAQREQLRVNREKALIVRRAKAQDKKELKDLQDQKKKKELKELKEFVNDEPKQEIIKEVIVEKKPEFTPEMIEALTQKSIQKALDNHEAQRQVRKQAKLIKRKEEEKDKKIKDMCTNASLYQRPVAKYGEAGFFDNCFN